MLNIRNFNENPLLSIVRYTLGKALLGKLYYKTEDGFELFDDKDLNKIEDLDPYVYYGLYIKKEDNKYHGEFKSNYLSFLDFVSLIVFTENKNKGLSHITFLEKEVFDYLEYKEHVTSLMEYYLNLKDSIELVSTDDIILKKQK